MRSSLMMSLLLAALLLCVSASALAGGEGAADVLLGLEKAPTPTTTETELFASFEQFRNGWFVVSLATGLLLSVACSLAMAVHPTRAGKADPVGDLDNRKTLVLLGMVGTVVAELVRVEPVIAFVVFGIGGLIRFRTVLSDPRITAKAVFVVVVGLACGMGAYAMAVFVTAFGWILSAWLGRHRGARIKLRLSSGLDPRDVLPAALEYVRRNHWRVASSRIIEDKRQILIFAEVIGEIDPAVIVKAMQASLPRVGGTIQISVKTQ